MGVFLRSTAAPLSRHVAAGGGPASLAPRAQALPPGRISGHPHVAWVDGYPMEQVPEPVDVCGPWFFFFTPATPPPRRPSVATTAPHLARALRLQDRRVHQLSIGAPNARGDPELTPGGAGGVGWVVTYLSGPLPISNPTGNHPRSPPDLPGPEMCH